MPRRLPQRVPREGLGRAPAAAMRADLGGAAGARATIRSATTFSRRTETQGRANGLKGWGFTLKGPYFSFL